MATASGLLGVGLAFQEVLFYKLPAQGGDGVVVIVHFHQAAGTQAAERCGVVVGCYPQRLIQLLVAERPGANVHCHQKGAVAFAEVRPYEGDGLKAIH